MAGLTPIFPPPVAGQERGGGHIGEKGERMNKKNTSVQNFEPSSYAGGGAQSIFKDFNDAVRALGSTKDSLEHEITDLRGEVDNLKKERVILEADMGEAREASELAMMAKAAEEEKQDALKKNQELRSFLDSAADTIKGFRIKIAEESNEIKRLGTRIKQLESEKISLVKERGELQAEMRRRDETIREQDWKARNLALQLESSCNDEKSVESELASTKKALKEIQDSMLSLKDKVGKKYPGA